MSWLGEWLGNWIGGWFGQGQQQQQPATVPYTRYGRVYNPNTDRLFGVQVGSSPLCEISSSAVCLGRTDTDDYVRMRVPDTDCPALPQPDWPLDAGVADFAEPDRWIFDGYYRPESNGWLFGPNPDDNLNYVGPSYTCYEGGFLTRVTASFGGSFQQPIYYTVDHFGLFVVLENSVAGIGFGGSVRPAEGNTFAVNMVLWHSVNGRTAYNVWVNLNTPVHLFIRRSGGTISVGWSVTNPNAPDPNTEIEVAYGVSGSVRFRLAKDFYLPETQPPQPPTARISATVSQWRTIYGAPSEIWVETPVVDLGEARRVEPRCLPGADLEWRASNSPFDAGDPTPSWSNPTGEYRYWQVRATSTSINTLIERIELISDAVPIALWRRFRSYWQLFETGAGRITKGPFRTVFGSGNQKRTGENEWTQDSDEERNVGDGWL
jgi:hypothetical protein